MPEQSQTLGLCKGLGNEGRLRDSKAIWGIGFAFGEHVPDSGQEHAANGDDGFLVTAVRLDAAVANAEFRVILGFNDSVGDLDKNRLQVGTRFGDTGGLDGFTALVISGSVTLQVFSRVLNTGIQYYPDDSMQTCVQLYLASQTARSLRPLEKA